MQSDWKHEDIELADMTMHYARSYSPGQPPLVLAHGFTDNGMCWLPVAQALSVDYDVILPDARGHGLSSRVTPGQPLDGAADLAAFIQALGLNRPIVGGHSMGASVAASMAARFPEIPGSLILEDPAWGDRFLPKTDEEEAAERAERERAAAEKGETIVDPWADWVATYQNRPAEEVIALGREKNPTWEEAEFPHWAESKLQMDPNYVSARSVTPRSDWREVVKAIQVPTLLITADPAKGGIVTPEVALEAQELNSLVRVVYFEEAGHNIRREAFEPFMEAVLTFLEDLKEF